MTDIVERLRSGAPCNDNGIRCRVLDAKSGCECAEAADEIERLRAAVQDRVARVVYLETECTKLMKELNASEPVTAEELTHALGNKPSFTLEVWVKAMLDELGPLYRQRKPMHCASCGTVTSDGQCDCTRCGNPQLQKLSPYTARASHE